MDRNLQPQLSRILIHSALISSLMMGAGEMGWAGTVYNYTNWTLQLNSCSDGGNIIEPGLKKTGCIPKGSQLVVSVPDDPLNPNVYVLTPPGGIIGSSSYPFDEQATMVITPDTAVDACNPPSPNAARRLQTKVGDPSTQSPKFAVASCYPNSTGNESASQIQTVTYTNTPTPPPPVPVPTPGTVTLNFTNKSQVTKNGLIFNYKVGDTIVATTGCIKQNASGSMVLTLPQGMNMVSSDTCPNSSHPNPNVPLIELEGGNIDNYTMEYMCTSFDKCKLQTKVKSQRPLKSME